MMCEDDDPEEQGEDLSQFQSFVDETPSLYEDAGSNIHLKAVRSDVSGNEENGAWADGLEGAPSLHLESMLRWITCILVVTFDLELGQAVEYAYPPDNPLNDFEKKNICFLSFPDSNAGYHGDMVFCFRTPAAPTKSATETVMVRSKSDGDRRDALGPSTSHLSGAESSFLSPQASRTPRSGSVRSKAGRPKKERHYYGSVYFRQVKDDTLKRGYFQKSVVIVSHRPYIGLCNRLVRLVAPEYFANGKPVLETVCNEISHWPPPAAGVMDLPFQGHTLSVGMRDEGDCATNFLYGDPYKRPGQQPDWELSAMQVCNIVGPYRTMLDDLWLLWELVLTAQPILVISQSPASCTEAVLALVSLIAPLKYNCDYRPFFTIHDPSFADYAKSDGRPPSAILGVNNPYFNNALEHWPHIIRLPAPPRRTLSRSGSPVQGRSPPPKAKTSGRGLWPATSSKLSKKPGVYSTATATVEKDKALLKQVAAMEHQQGSLSVPSDLADLSKSPSLNSAPSLEATGLTGVESSESARDWAQSVAILRMQHGVVRDHFFQLTQNFMGPLEQYYASLLPLQKKISPWRPIPRIKKFDRQAFLETIPENLRGFSGVRRTSLIVLYERFINSPNFDGWLRDKTRGANRRVKGLYLDMLCQADMAQWMSGRSELEAVDQLLRLRELLGMKSELLTPPVIAKVQEHIETIVRALPEDLRNSLRTS